jgi:protein-disulfide isomerase
MATHITGLVLAALVIWRVRAQLNDEVSPVAARRATGRLPAIGLALIGVTLAGIMAAGQVAFAPAAVSRGGESPGFTLPAIDAHKVPLIGSPDAPFVVALLFDYECPHCQQLHALLEETIRRSGGRLAFALCPAPLNTHCNPYIPQDIDVFKDSCELTRIALAVWVANHEAFPDFDRWMFSPDPGEPWHPRTLEAAKAKAIELVGHAKYDTARADLWIDQYLQISVRIFGATGANAVPKLVFGPRWVNPEPNDADDLVAIIQSSLGVPKP